MKNEDIKKRVNNLLSKMTLKEKIGQLNQDSLNDKNVDEIKTKVKNGSIGSIILATSATAGNDQQQKCRIDIINEIERIAIEEGPHGIPVIFGRDVIHGHNTVLPVPLALSATFNPALVKDGYKCIAKEAANDGIHWAFSPMIDISRDPRWGRCIEGIGEDPYLGEKMASAIVDGFQGEDYSKKDSIAACAKHYIGYGAAEGGRDYVKAEISDYTLRNYYLKPFKAAVKSKVATVMNAFNEVSGQPCASSKYLLNDLLKDELGFDGFVISDWGSIWALTVQGVAKNEHDAAELAINAGLDMDMMSKCYTTHIEKLVEEGKVTEKTIDDAVARILYIKMLFGLFDHPYAEHMDYETEQHRQVAKRCSDESMVLLKNRNGILPLSKDMKVYVTGPLAHEKRAYLGSWTLDGDLDLVHSVAEVFEQNKCNSCFAESKYMWDDCLKGIRNSDAAVVILGESQKMTGEANSVAHIELPLEQMEFVKKIHSLGRPIIGVIIAGRPLALESCENYFDAILYAWHSGTCTADSVWSILYGEVNPSGCLPMSFPRCTGQVPIYYNYPGAMSTGCGYYYSEDVIAYNDSLSTPMYPFGYGLSYTEFKYYNIYCSEDKIAYKDILDGKKFKLFVTVKNIGKYAGKETVQCYIHDKVASMTRPLKELKGISKEYFEPDEEKEICFELGLNELAFYNANAEFKPEPGEFEIYIGRDCYAEKCMSIYII